MPFLFYIAFLSIKKFICHVKSVHESYSCLPVLLQAHPEGQSNRQRDEKLYMIQDPEENLSPRSLAYRAQQHGSHAQPNDLSGTSSKTKVQGSHE